MCWIGPRIEHRATKDIVTFKLLYKDPNTHQLYSLYRGFQYKLNTLYQCPLGISLFDSKDVKINEGFHSYNERCRIEKFNAFYGIIAPDIWLYLESIRCYSDGLVFIKTIIPKGSIYYQTDNGEMVSDQIILLEEWKREVLE